MTSFKVFIGSSNDEKEEREALKNLLSKANIVTRDYGVEISPEMWEMQPTNMTGGLREKQSEYNRLLLSCDMAIFLFSKRVGKYTLEEFKLACNDVRQNKKLNVSVHFKNSQIGSINEVKETDLENAENVLALKTYITNDLKQVYAEYKTIQELIQNVVRDILNILLPTINTSSQLSESIKKIKKLYDETDKPFQIAGRDSIISDTYNSLFFLSKYNLTPDQLKKDDFYYLLHKIISPTQPNEDIKALSVMLKSEWDDSDDEKEFWRDNQEAVRRGVLLERIFIVDKDKSHRLKTIPQIKNHVELEESFDNIHSYVVERENLQRNAPHLLERAGNGFILINANPDPILFLDNKTEYEQRAKPVLDINEISKTIKLFNELKNHAMPLREYLHNITWSHCKKEMISIFVTTKCNLNCDYCFTNKNEDKHKNQTIDFDFVKKGIDDYFKEEYMRHVRFFGAGEPTVELELLKKIHDYAVKSGGKAVTFEIQTNGAFSDNVANWLKKNIDIIWISCDGTPDIQDLHRPFLHNNNNRKTSSVIEKNIRILHAPDSKSFVGIRSTITLENINRQKEMIDYFFELGIKNIWVDPIFPAVGETELPESNQLNTMSFAAEFLEAAKYAYEKGVFYGSILTCNFSDIVNKHCRACLPVPHLTTDGYVSACDMALFGDDNNHMSPLIYGKWDKDLGAIDYYEPKIENLRSRTTENMQHCEMCSAKEHCGGYCLGEVLNETHDLRGKKRGVCNAIRFLDKNLTAEMRKYKYTHP